MIAVTFFDFDPLTHVIEILFATAVDPCEPVELDSVMDVDAWALCVNFTRNVGEEKLKPVAER